MRYILLELCTPGEVMRNAERNFICFRISMHQLIRQCRYIMKLKRTVPQNEILYTEARRCTTWGVICDKHSSFIHTFCTEHYSSIATRSKQHGMSRSLAVMCSDVITELNRY